MAIIKGKDHAQLAVNVPGVQTQVIDSINDLLVSPPLAGKTLNGISANDVKVDSELITLRNDDRATYAAVADSSTGGKALAKRSTTNRRKPLLARTHNVVLTPFGIHQVTGADGGGLQVTPRVGLQLPTSKLKH